MKVIVHPADKYGCGHFRMIWPGELLAAQGHNIHVTYDRIRLVMDRNTVRDILLPHDVDVIVLQRIIHRWMAEAIPIFRAKGVAVVVDVDDDLTSVHPSNPAWTGMHPRNEGKRDHNGQIIRTSWRNLTLACRNATLVTVSTPALLPIYAAHGRGHVLPNYLPDSYYEQPHVDSDTIGWPASYHSHPNDPEVLGGSLARLVDEGAAFRMVGSSDGAGRALGMAQDPPGGAVDIATWPRTVAELGIGIAPLADTRFNSAKSWLKPMELSALGVPWVASPRAEYARLHRMGAGQRAEAAPRVGGDARGTVRGRP